MIVKKTKAQLEIDINDIELQDEQGKTLKILLGGNGNLYWCYKNNRNDGYNSFEVTKELYGNTIEFDRNNSLYNPFNKVFINMFEELQKYDNQYHQIHIEEIEYEKTKKFRIGA